LYGQKQAGRVWYLHLRKNLLKLGFKPSQHDECVFYYGKTVFIVYTDDTILLGLSIVTNIDHWSICLLVGN
jgi:hypothetical protein